MPSTIHSPRIAEFLMSGEDQAEPQPLAEGRGRRSNWSATRGDAETAAASGITNQTISAPRVFVVDDDPAARAEWRRRAATANCPCLELGSTAELLDSHAGAAGCLLLVHRAADVRLVDFLMERQSRQWSIPTIVVAPGASVPLAVQAMHHGAYWVFDHDAVTDAELTATIRAALAADAARGRHESQRRDVRRRLATLSPRERGVMELIVAGETSKVIARRLNLRLRTAELARQKLFQKMGVDSSLRLVILVLQSGATIA